jgi:MFS family permease
MPGDSQQVGLVMSIPELTAIFGTPLCGLFFDKYGHRSILLAIAGSLIVLAHSVLAFTTITPYVGMSLIGTAYSIFGSAIWTFIPRLVHSNQIATAYGLMTGAMNLSLFVFPLVVAIILGQSNRGDFHYVQLFFMCLASGSVFLSTLLYYRKKPNRNQ